MSEIDIIITRHGKKDKSVEDGCKAQGIPFVAGGKIDRTQVGLSAEGAKEVEEIGRSELAGKTHDAIYVATSDFLRTHQTADAILRGAGYDPEELRNGRRISIATYDRIGLSGTDWKSVEDANGAKVPFGDDQKVLDRYVNTILERYFLERADEPGNPNKRPVMARRGAALLEALANGVSEIPARLKFGQRGLVLLVTHAPTIDSFASVASGNLTFEETDEHTLDGNDVYEVELAPIEAHNQGQYIMGRVRTEGDYQLDTSPISLTIKGKEYVLPVRDVHELGREMKYASYNGVQR